MGQNVSGNNRSNFLKSYKQKSLAALEKIELKDRTIGDPRIWVKIAEKRGGDSGEKGSWKRSA